MKRIVVLHPFLFATYPVLALYANNRFEMRPAEIALPIASGLAISLLLWFLCWAVLRSVTRAGLLTSLALVLFSSYGHVYSMLQEPSLGLLGIGRNRYLLPLWALIFLAGGLALLRTRRKLGDFSLVLNVVAAALVGLVLVQTLPLDLGGRISVSHLAERDDREWQGRAVRGAHQIRPDIYYVILDRYTSDHVLDKTYHYDNSAFTEFLRSRGFYVASESRANYAGTFLSMASSLNLIYLDEVQEEAAGSRDRTLIYSLLQDYKVQRYLKSEGYRYIHLGSWWQPTRSNPYADQNVDYGSPLSEFSRKLVTTTLLGPVFPALFYRPRVHRERVFFKFEKMAELIREPGPKFVFLHFLIPHDPYLFNRDGSAVTDAQRLHRSEAENYVNQLEFTNAKMIQLIDQIFSVSERPPVVLLAADEGLKLPAVERRNQLTPKRVTQRLGILNAYYLPGVDASQLYPSISPVNTFRLLFDLYFGTSYGLLEDRSYWFEDDRDPYRFIDVTAMKW